MRCISRIREQCIIETIDIELHMNHSCGVAGYLKSIMRDALAYPYKTDDPNQ